MIFPLGIISIELTLLETFMTYEADAGRYFSFPGYVAVILTTPSLRALTIPELTLATLVSLLL